MRIGTAPSSSRKTSLSGLLRRFARSTRGVTVIEFAIVGPIFFGLIGATIETAITFFAGYALDTAVIDTSRLIRTGQSSYTHTAKDYRAALCGQLYGMFDCDEIRIGVKKIDSFADFSPTYPIDPSSGAWSYSEAYESIGDDAYVMIEAYYKWPTIFNIPGLNAGQTADGKRLLAAAHVFRTEPTL